MSADERTTVTAEGWTIPLEIFRPDAGTQADAGERRVDMSGRRPDASGRRPAVLVLHEIFGLNDDMRRIARRFADAGYLAAAPDFLAGGWYLGCIMRAARDLRAGNGPTVGVLETVLADLAARPDVGRVGAAGFCMGGGYALLLGTRQRVDAAAVFYGDVRSTEELAHVCPLTGGYGGKDRIFGPQGRDADRPSRRPRPRPRRQDVRARRPLVHERHRPPMARDAHAPLHGGRLRPRGRRRLLAAHARLLRAAPVTRSLRAVVVVARGDAESLLRVFEG